MRKIIIFLALAVLLNSLVSAEIIITLQPKEIYNLGETISIPVTIKSSAAISNVFQMNLICSGSEINFYKNGVGLSMGEEKKMDPSLILTKNMIAELKGNCIIKAILGEDYVLTKEFIISDLINVNTEIKTPEINPGEFLVINGGAVTESGKVVDGFIQADVYSLESNSEESTITSQLETINNGFFSLNITIPESTKAGKYIVTFKAYEKDLSSAVTNQGIQRNEFSVNQMPKNLEIIIENKEVMPGASLKAKVILHDQTGQNINTETTIKIKNSKNKLKEKIDVATDEFFEFPTAYNEMPQDYFITATAAGLEANENFKVKEKTDIQVQIINRTLIIKNTGNVPYCNKTLLIRIGNQTLNLDPCIDIDKEEKYTLTAPDGNYEVEIITDEKEYKENVALTGKAIDIKEASAGVVSLTRHPFIWFFVIAILGFISFTVFKKGFKRSFIGYIHKRKDLNISPGIAEKLISPSKNRLFSANPAELCLSIKGEKQTAAIVGLKIKNYKDAITNKEGIKESAEQISSIAKAYKASVYENQESTFFILAPLITKTFKNEMPALEMAMKIKEVLAHHNKLFKQKLEFGIAVGYGTIIAKQSANQLEFMSLGDLMTQIKKIANASNEVILLSEKIKEKLGAEIRTEKSIKNSIPVYEIKEIKEKGQHDKFIKGFLNRIEKK